MKKVYSAQNGVLVHSVKNALLARGVACEVRGEALGTALGEVPPIECWPQLWVLDDERVAEAESIVAQAMQESVDDGPAWVCSRCGEDVEGTFGCCWSCGAAREG